MSNLAADGAAGAGRKRDRLRRRQRRRGRRQRGDPERRHVHDQGVVKRGMLGRGQPPPRATCAQNWLAVYALATRPKLNGAAESAVLATASGALSVAPLR